VDHVGARPEREQHRESRRSTFAAVFLAALFQQDVMRLQHGALELREELAFPVRIEAAIEVGQMRHVVGDGPNHRAARLCAVGPPPDAVRH